MPVADASNEPGEEILILAPTGQDGQLLAAAISGVRSRIVNDAETLCERVRRNAAAALIVAEEALSDTVLARLNAALEGQEPWSDIPIILMTNSGETTLAILRIKKAFSPSGNLTLLERPFRRITLQSTVEVALRARRRQHQVKDLLEKQRSATQLRDEFISMAGHELRTPLTAMKLEAEVNQLLIQRGDPAVYAPDKMQKIINSTLSQVNRLTRLIEDMLDITRIDTGKLDLQTEEVDLSQLLRHTVQQMEPQLLAAGCKVDLQFEVPIAGQYDRYRLEQVMNNLLINAIRYSPGKRVRISLSGRSDAALLVVSDEGPGIAPEHHERIFSRFERVVTNGVGGLGLGLYISRKIVEAHQGTIHVESTPGQGSRFIVALPLTGIRAGQTPLQTALPN
jgi:signal transduction histidine kinase